MEIRISNLKTEFNNISLIRSKIINVFESLKNKSDKLKNLYTDFIKQSKTQLFVFGLDSFHFQSKLIDLEYDDMMRIFLFVNNRMYCEYFKLYKIIASYVIENVTDKKILENIKGNNFPVYKDLEPFKDYKFEITLEIHENILVLLNSINSIINNRENELSIHKSKQLIGLNIDNFVYSFNYEIILMKEKVNLFLSYIEFFHKLHTKYLKRFSNKIQLMSTHINNDIQFDENVENDTIFNKKNDECLLDNEELINRHNLETCNNTNLKLSIDTSDFNNDMFEYCENDLNTFSDKSHKSSESKKMKLPKFIKNGFKKVTDMFIGCNFKETYSTTSDNSELLLEKLSNNNDNDDNDTTCINLNDFNEIISREEDVIIEEQPLHVVEEPHDSVVEEQLLHVVEEIQVALVEEEPLPVVEEPPVAVVEEPLHVVEEPPLPVVEEPQVAVVEEPPVDVVEEPPVDVVEEPLPVVEEPPVTVVEEPLTVVEEPPLPVVEEPQVAVVEESIN
jgi:hypothetical protein